MELSKKHLKQVFGGNIIGAGSDGSPGLPEKKQLQSVDTSSLASSLITDPAEPLKH